MCCLRGVNIRRIKRIQTHTPKGTTSGPCLGVMRDHFQWSASISLPRRETQHTANSTQQRTVDWNRHNDTPEKWVELGRERQRQRQRHRQRRRLRWQNVRSASHCCALYYIRRVCVVVVYLQILQVYYTMRCVRSFHTFQIEHIHLYGIHHAA